VTICFKRVHQRFKNQGPVALDDLGSFIEMSHLRRFCLVAYGFLPRFRPAGTPVVGKNIS